MRVFVAANGWQLALEAYQPIYRRWIGEGRRSAKHAGAVWALSVDPFGGSGLRVRIRLRNCPPGVARFRCLCADIRWLGSVARPRADLPTPIDDVSSCFGSPECIYSDIPWRVLEREIHARRHPPTHLCRAGPRTASQVAAGQRGNVCPARTARTALGNGIDPGLPTAPGHSNMDEGRLGGPVRGRPAGPSAELAYQRTDPDSDPGRRDDRCL